jgi:hypothetical protein
MNQEEINQTRKEIRDFIPSDMYGDDLIEYLMDDNDDSGFDKLFTKEQRVALLALFKKVMYAQSFHEYKDKNPHDEQLSDLSAKLRNHRHDTTKQYSAKPEF